EYATEYDWQFILLPTAALRLATEDGEEPEGGWEGAYRRQIAMDRGAISNGSASYTGRQRWLKTEWARNTAIYPLYVVREDSAYRLWDGYRRLAAAFHHR